MQVFITTTLIALIAINTLLGLVAAIGMGVAERHSR